MGQTYCTSCCNGQKLTSYQMDIQLYKKQFDHTPLQQFAIQVKNSIELSPYVKQIYSKYFYDHIPQRNGGIKLKLHYLFNYAAYYQGQWKLGLPHGQGKLIYDDGSLYHGCFYQGIASCKQAIFISYNGTFYRGNVKANKANGMGKLNTNKFYYQGQWKNDLPNGKGKQIYSTFSYYDGQFKEGRKQGQGIYCWNKNEYYLGDFCNNVMHGQGQLYLKQFNYKGSFKQGIKQGKGKLLNLIKKWSYQGQFKNDQMNGYGVYTWQDGTKFQGDFINDQRTDQGIMTFPHSNKIIQFSKMQQQNI